MSNNKQPSSMMITLPYEKDTCFHISRLLRHLVQEGCPYIIIGNQHVISTKHTKEHSLDYWIRKNIARNSGTGNATKDLVDQLVATDLFERQEELVCPDSGNTCMGVALKVGT